MHNPFCKTCDNNWQMQIRIDEFWKEQNKQPFETLQEL